MKDSLDTSTPPAKVVEGLMAKQYEEIRKAGGLPLVVTATGKGIVVHPALHEARCDSCRLTPHATDEFECHLRILISLEPDGRNPSWKGERLFVRRHADGSWGSD